MTGPLVVRPGLLVPAGELDWRFSHSGGPGGQSVNTSDTRVELSLDLGTTTALDERQRGRVLDVLGPRLVGTTLTVVASEHRSQLRNREAAMGRMAALIRDAVRPPPPPRRPTRPSRSAVERRLTAKRRQGERKRLRRSGDDGG